MVVHGIQVKSLLVRSLSFFKVEGHVREHAEYGDEDGDDSDGEVDNVDLRIKSASQISATLLRHNGQG